VKVLHEDIIGDEFWDKHPLLLQEMSALQKRKLQAAQAASTKAAKPAGNASHTKP